MKSIVNYLLALLLCVNLSVYTTEVEAKQPVKQVQNAKKNKKSPTKKNSTQQSQNTNAVKVNSTKSHTSRKKARKFEGQLMYVTNEYANKLAKTFSMGLLFNGNRTLFITIKGDEFDIYDATLHQHTIMKPNKKTAIIYSDVTKKGIVISGSDFEKIYDPFYKTGQVTIGDKLFIRDLKDSTDPTVNNFKGDDCKVYQGLITQSEPGNSPMAETRGELWMVPDLTIDKSLSFFFYGFTPAGVVKKGLINYNARVPILGSFKVQQALELIGINERPVKASELEAPANVTLTPATNSLSFNRAHNKALKKAGLKPKQMKVREVKKAVSEKWDFAYEWDTYTIQPPTNEYTAWQLATDILSLTGNRGNLWLSNGNPSATVFDERDDFAASENAYYIPTLLGRLYSERSNLQSHVGGSTGKAPKVHKPGKVPHVDPYIVSQLKITAVDESAWRHTAESIAKEWDKRINFVENYAQKNKTNYIPMVIYDKFIAKREAALKKSSDIRKQHRKFASDLSNRTAYNMEVNNISTEAYSSNPIDIKSIRQSQKRLKEIRKKHPEIIKSPWEDWSPGDPKP